MALLIQKETYYKFDSVAFQNGDHENLKIIIGYLEKVLFYFTLVICIILCYRKVYGLVERCSVGQVD